MLETVTDDAKYFEKLYERRQLSAEARALYEFNSSLAVLFPFRGSSTFGWMHKKFQHRQGFEESRENNEKLFRLQLLRVCSLSLVCFLRFTGKYIFLLSFL